MLYGPTTHVTFCAGVVRIRYAPLGYACSGFRHLIRELKNMTIRFSVKMSLTTAALCVNLVACAAHKDFQKDNVVDVYVQDFHSAEPASCRKSDVDLNHSKAGEFFKRAKIVDAMTLHDHYNIA